MPWQRKPREAAVNYYRYWVRRQPQTSLKTETKIKTFRIQSRGVSRLRFKSRELQAWRFPCDSTAFLFMLLRYLACRLLFFLIECKYFHLFSSLLLVLCTYISSSYIRAIYIKLGILAAQSSTIFSSMWSLSYFLSNTICLSFTAILFLWMNKLALKWMKIT